MKTALFAILVAGVCFGTGWLAGRHHRNSGPLVRFTAEEMAGRKRNAAPGLVDPVAAAPSSEEAPADSALHWRPLPGERDAFEDAVRSATPAELKAIILSLGEPPEPAWAAQDLFRFWAERDPQGARWYFEQLPPLSQFALMQDFIAGWSARDAPGVVAWLTTQRSNAAVSNARASVLGRIAKDDPEEACATLRSTGWLHDSPEALRTIIFVWIETDPATAMQRWRELNLELNPPATPEADPPVPPFSSELISWIMKDAQARGPKAIVEAIELFSAEELRKGVDSRWTHSSPETILPALERKLSTDQMKGIVYHLLSQMPEKADAIARVLRSPELRELRWPQPVQKRADDEETVPLRVSLDEPIRLAP